MSYPIGPLRVPTVGQTSQTHASTQPPLIPSGFIQNEHGTLIAVYQQEALSRYMAGGEQANVAHHEAKPHHFEAPQPSTTHQVSHQMSVNTAPFHRAPGAQNSQTPYREGSQPFDRHRPQNHQYNNVVRTNQPSNTGRPYTGRSGRGYLQNTPIPRGGQAGRTFGDWSR